VGSLDDYRASVLSKMDFFLYRCAMNDSYAMTNVTEGFQRITGYPVSKILNNQTWGFIQLVHPEDVSIGTARCKKAIEEKQPTWNSEYRIVTADGSVKWVRDSCGSVFDKQGRLKFLEGVIYDINDLHQRVERRQQALKVAAAQTNNIMHHLRYLKLLALNASIEAARVGVHGAGFNNLAQDMRNLAEQAETAAIAVRKSAA
jgi:PAS domain S-box-containing protein